MSLQGYRGRVLEILEAAGVAVGDRIRVRKSSQVFEGVLMPRSELGDDQHIVLKLDDGYNIGIAISEDLSVEKLGAFVEIKPQLPPIPIEKREGLPHVAIVSTGGTIASRVDYRTGAVSPALTAQDLYSVVPELSNIAYIEAEVLYSIFSENMKPEYWSGMAKRAAKYIEEGVDGIVVTHGTDTLGYSSAALSFALRNLPCPVVFVGSQRSSDRPSSDAAMNLVSAVTFAGKSPIAEVVIVMHGESGDTYCYAHRGTKVRKCHTSRRDAFRSINAQPLARVKEGVVEVLTSNYNPRKESRDDFYVDAEFDEKVVLIKSFPGMTGEFIDHAVDKRYHGIVLEGTGLGHVPMYIFDSIKRAVEEGLAVVMTSQCLWGRINMNVYSTGRELLAMGVIPGEDMLPETALVKLMWVLAKTQDLKEVKKLMLTNIAGEISPRTCYSYYFGGEVE